ncbi:MAG: copper chaperone [Rhodospirillales bacterium]|nr:copper chaperone [Rhodospirillales bacterium]
MTQYRVNGMTCNGCANAVSNAIKAAAPQAAVTVDLAAKIVTVEGPVAAASVAAAVNAAGFEFAGTATPTARP